MSESLIGSYWAFPISGCGFRRKKLSYKLIFSIMSNAGGNNFEVHIFLLLSSFDPL